MPRLTVGVRLALVMATLVVIVGTSMLAVSYVLLVQWLPDSIVLQGPAGEVAVPMAGTLPEDSGVQWFPEGTVLQDTSCELAVLTAAPLPDGPLPPDPLPDGSGARWLPESLTLQARAGEIGILTLTAVTDWADAPWLPEATVLQGAEGELGVLADSEADSSLQIQFVPDTLVLQAPTGEDEVLVAGLLAGRTGDQGLPDSLGPWRPTGAPDEPMARPLDAPDGQQVLDSMILLGPDGELAVLMARPVGGGTEQWRPEAVVVPAPGGDRVVLTARRAPVVLEDQQLPDGTVLIGPSCEVVVRTASPLPASSEVALFFSPVYCTASPLPSGPSAPTSELSLAPSDDDATQLVTGDDACLREPEGQGSDAVGTERLSVAGRTPTFPVVDGTPAATADDLEPQVDLLLTELVQATARDYRARIMQRFATQSAIMLTLLTIAAVAVGWAGSRRLLRPVHAMSATAQRLGGGSLDERILISGPRDELRELAETFNAMLDRVEEAFGRERRFMANVSHELRTPLANQQVALELALEDPDASADDLRRAAGIALAQTVRAEHLIEELLILARAEQGLADPATNSCDLADAARHAIDAVQAVPDATSALDLTADLSPAVVKGHPALIERLVGNLVENAVRHNHPGGFVRVTTTQLDGAGRIEVENSGPFVPAASVDELFEPFRRGSPGQSDRVRSDRGAGLGLSVVAAVVQRYGARLQATARPEGGLRVAITLDAPNQGAPGSDPRTDVSSAPGESGE